MLKILIKIKLYWVANKSFKQNKQYYKNNNFYLVYHMDLDR